MNLKEEDIVLLKYLLQHIDRYVPTVELVVRLHIPDNKVRYHLNKLAREGLVEKRKEKGVLYWRLTLAGARIASRLKQKI